MAVRFCFKDYMKNQKVKIYGIFIDDAVFISHTVRDFNCHDWGLNSQKKKPQLYNYAIEKKKIILKPTLLEVVDWLDRFDAVQYYCDEYSENYKILNFNYEKYKYKCIKDL